MIFTSVSFVRGSLRFEQFWLFPPAIQSNSPYHTEKAIGNLFLKRIITA